MHSVTQTLSGFKAQQVRDGTIFQELLTIQTFIGNAKKLNGFKEFSGLINERYQTWVEDLCKAEVNETQRLQGQIAAIKYLGGVEEMINKKVITMKETLDNRARQIKEFEANVATR